VVVVYGESEEQVVYVCTLTRLDTLYYVWVYSFPFFLFVSLFITPNVGIVFSCMCMADKAKLADSIAIPPNVNFN